MDANAHTVHTGFDQDPLALIAGHCERVQEHFGRTGSFDFGDIMSLGGLGCEVRYGESRRQGGSDALEVRAEGLRLNCQLGVEVGYVYAFRLTMLMIGQRDILLLNHASNDLTYNHKL